MRINCSGNSLLLDTERCESKMSKKLFYKNFLFLSVGLALLLMVQFFIPVLKEHLIFSWTSWVFFVFFTYGVYVMAERAAKSPNLNTFTSIILGVIFIKMLFIMVIVLIYKNTVNPTNAWFLLPFLIIYLAFTIFEVYFMNKLGRIKPPLKTKESEVQSTSE